MNSYYSNIGLDNIITVGQIHPESEPNSNIIIDDTFKLTSNFHSLHSSNKNFIPGRK